MRLKSDTLPVFIIVLHHVISCYTGVCYNRTITKCITKTKVIIETAMSSNENHKKIGMTGV